MPLAIPNTNHTCTVWGAKGLACLILRKPSKLSQYFRSCLLAPKSGSRNQAEQRNCKALS